MKTTAISILLFLLIFTLVNCDSDYQDLTSTDTDSELESQTHTEGAVVGNELSGSWSTSSVDSMKAGDVTFDFNSSESKLDFYFTDDDGITSVITSRYEVTSNENGTALDGLNDTMKIKKPIAASRAIDSINAFVYAYSTDSENVVFKLVEMNGVKQNVGAVVIEPYKGETNAKEVEQIIVDVEIIDFDTSYNDTNTTYDDSTNNNTTHYDSTYNDTTYNDTTHYDSTYIDTTHYDSTYNDTTHYDSTYNDTTHYDSTYNDTTHYDSTYNDTTHYDSTHNDTIYIDTTDNNSNHYDSTNDLTITYIS
jgi:hypothetical protein